MRRKLDPGEWAAIGLLSGGLSLSAVLVAAGYEPTSTRRTSVRWGLNFSGPGDAQRPRAWTTTGRRVIDMAQRTCSIDGCERRSKCRGWCGRHYDRWRNHGDPLAGTPVTTETYPPCEVAGCDRPQSFRQARCKWHRFWDDVDKSGDCWIWRGATANQFGYGRTSVLYDELGERQCNRVSYTLLVGPIADGMHLDHLCRNPPCVNPAHLEPVTPAENTHRSPIAPAALNARKTHCKYGHEFAAENTRWGPDGHRSCIECSKRRSAEYQKRRPPRIWVDGKYVYRHLVEQS